MRAAHVLQLLYGFVCFAYWSFLMGYVLQLPSPPTGTLAPLIGGTVFIGAIVFGIAGIVFTVKILKEDAWTIFAVYGSALIVALILQILSSDLQFPAHFGERLRFVCMFLSLATAVYALGKATASDPYAAITA